MKKTKILFVGAFVPPSRTKVRGGVQFECQSLIGSPLSKHVEWDLVDTTMISIPPPPFFRRLMLASRRFITFAQKIIFCRPDCCLIYLSNGASFVEKGAMALVARSLGVRVVLRPVSGLIVDEYRQSAIFRWYIRYVIRTVGLISCQGTFWREFFQSVGSLALEHAPVIYSPINTSDYVQLLASGRGKGERVLMIGWVERNKGIWDLLEVVRRFSREFEGMIFVVCGHGLEFVEFRDAVALAGLGHFFELRGWVSWEEKLLELERCEIYLMLSHREGLPNALLEAMASGRAIVATSVGAVPDVISDGTTGCLCEPGDVDDIGFRILELRNSAPLRARLGAAARQVIEQKFDYDVTWRKWSEILVGSTTKD